MDQDALRAIRTVRDMVTAFADEACRRSARPGLYPCARNSCRKQFTVTTCTPLHATKLPTRTWLTAVRLILQSDKGLSSPRLAKVLGVSQPTAWRIGHAVRLMSGQERLLGGIVEADVSCLGGAPRSDADRPRSGWGRKGRPRTGKAAVLGLVERPAELTPGAPAGEVRARTAASGSNIDIGRLFEETVTADAHLMSDEAKTFMAPGTGFPAHDTVYRSERSYVRGTVHADGAEGLADRVRRTAVGVFHHISPAHADLYLGEISWRWSQRSVAGRAIRTTRKGRSTVQTQWKRTPAAEQPPSALRSIVGRQMRRTKARGIAIKSRKAVFG